jgi:hypothetical protein
LYDSVSDGLVASAEALHDSLRRDGGPGMLVLPNFVADEFVASLRAESQGLWEAGRFEASYSEVTDGASGETTRHYKDGVHSLELAGSEGDEAPFLLHYTAAVMHVLPRIVTHYFGDAEGVRLSAAEYGTKLAVTLGDGAKYPRHVDNVATTTTTTTTTDDAPPPDLRKVTVILYLNPGWDAAAHGGELRAWCGERGAVEDVEPGGGTLVAFWSDLVVHEVLPSTADATDPTQWRHALTLWLVADDPEAIADATHPLARVKEEHFPPHR